MEYNVTDIVKLLVKDNYLSPLNGELLKKQPESIKIYEMQVSVLKENLIISLNSGNLTPRSIRDFTSLLKAIENVKGDSVLSIQITYNSIFRTIFIDTLLQNTFDEI